MQSGIVGVLRHIQTDLILKRDIVDICHVILLGKRAHLLVPLVIPVRELGRCLDQDKVNALLLAQICHLLQITHRLVAQRVIRKRRRIREISLCLGVYTHVIAVVAYKILGKNVFKIVIFKF